MTDKLTSVGIADLQSRSERFPEGVDGFDVRGTFTTLTLYTTPHGFEWMQHHELLPSLGFELDKSANYRGVINKPDGSPPETIFIAHLDTVGSVPPKRVTHHIHENTIRSDGETILGADDKAGVTVLLYLIHKNVPGLYIFTWGEETGRQGSRAFATTYTVNKYKRAIAFDRKGTTSIITKQSGKISCSDEFADALIKEFANHDMTFAKDPGGSFTDTVSFFGEVPECTNISVGYENAHSPTELQNLDHLERLCHAAGRVNWEELPTVQDTEKRSAGGKVYYGTGSKGYSHASSGAADPWDEGRWSKSNYYPPATQGRALPQASTKAAEKGEATLGNQTDDEAEAQEEWNTIVELAKHNALDMDCVEDFVFRNPEATAHTLLALIQANPFAARQHVIRIPSDDK